MQSLLPTLTPLSSARLIVCERDGSWSIGLRKELAESGVSVWECRSVQEAWEAMAHTPAAFLIAEATPENLDDLRGGWLGSPAIFPKVELPWWPSGAWRVSSGFSRGGGGPLSHVAAAARAPGRLGRPSPGERAATIAVVQRANLG